MDIKGTTLEIDVQEKVWEILENDFMAVVAPGSLTDRNYLFLLEEIRKNIEGYNLERSISMALEELLKKIVPDVPKFGTKWDDMIAFVLSYRADLHESSEICQTLQGAFNNSGKVKATTQDARSALFFLQRAWRHTDHIPTDEDMIFVEELLECIRRNKK